MRTVLLVEDQRQVREVLERMLARTGCRVLTAVDGQDALRVQEEFPGAIDVLLTDVVLPGMSGPELAQEMNKVRIGIRTLFMSGYPNDVILKHVGEAAPSAILTKPFEWKHLADTLRRLFTDPEPVHG